MIEQGAPSGVADSMPLNKSAVLGVDANYNVIPRCRPSPPANELVEQCMHISDAGSDTVPTLVQGLTLPFRLDQSAQSLGSARPGWEPGEAARDALVLHGPVAHGTSWFSVPTPCSTSSPPTVVTTPEDIRLTIPGTSLQQHIEDTLGGNSYVQQQGSNLRIYKGDPQCNSQRGPCTPLHGGRYGPAMRVGFWSTWASGPRPCQKP